jgi:hypothetical protein
MMKIGADSNQSEWVQDYCSAHPLLVLAEASVIMPGPRCIGLAPIHRWSGDSNLRGDGLTEPPADDSLLLALERVASSEGLAMSQLLLRNGAGGACLGSSFANIVCKYPVSFRFQQASDESCGWDETGHASQVGRN